MTTQVTFGAKQSEIAQQAVELHAKWVVVWQEHYRGNCKGYYQSVEVFLSSNIFHWNNSMDDRGAVMVLLTDEDVPAMIEEKKEMVRQLNMLDVELSRERARQLYIPIDGRWSKSNPKYIDAMKQRAEQMERVGIAEKKYNEGKRRIEQQLKHLNTVSSTMLEVRF